MKRIVLFLLICILAAPLVAEEAKPRQKGALRTQIVPTCTFSFSRFNENGKGRDENTIQTARVGLAAEYGLIDWLALGVSWVPLWTFWSHFEQDDNLRINGLHDIDVSVRFQLIGERSLIAASNKVRLAAAAALILPMTSADWESEEDNQVSGDDYKIADPDKHAWGIGGRLYFDYVFSQAFFINFYTEFIKYLNKDYEDVSYATYSSPGPDDYNYGWDLTFELELTLEHPLSADVHIGASLPINIEFTPDVSIDGSSVDDTSTYLLRFGPEFSIYFPRLFIPTEFRLFYLHPILGRNISATHEYGLYVQSYIKF